MKKIFIGGLDFVRENPRIIYSFVLLVFVPAAFFFNTYNIISGMERDIDRITQRKAVLVERVINDVASEKMDKQDALQTMVMDVTANNDEILSMAILKPDADPNRFSVFAASDVSVINESFENMQYTLAWSRDEGIAFLEHDSDGRFWRVTRLLHDASGAKIGLISIAFPLADSDALIDQTVNRSYLVLVVTVIAVLLLVSNQARLFGSVLALNKLKEIDEMKDNLVSMASHELRSPLTAMRGYIELLEMKDLRLDADAKKYLANISLSVDRLNTLVNDMLEVSRLEGNRIPMNMVVFDPRAVIEQSVEELRSQAIQKGLELKVESLAEATVLADIDRTKEILVNLIGNALKYTAKGSVRVSSQEKDGRYSLTVADTGFGISAEDQKKLFQKFSRIQTEQTKTISGTGLGLWITFGLAEKMSGSITVESIEGVGSHFTLHLPIKR